MSNDDRQAQQVDIDLLTMALQGDGLQTGWWLDLHTGEVMPEPEVDAEAESNISAADQRLIKQREQDPERFHIIEPLASDVMHDLMHSYVSTIEDAALSECLLQALEKEQAAWYFKQALAEDPETEDAWYAFKEAFFKLQARQWARDMGLGFAGPQGEDAEGSPQTPGPIAANEQQTFLEMRIHQGGMEKTYVIWSAADDAFFLSADEHDADGNRRQAECELSARQIEKINKLLARHPATMQIGLAETISFGPDQVELKVIDGNRETAIRSPLQADDDFGQLQTLFEFILDI